MSSRSFVVLEKDEDLRAIYRRKIEQKFPGCIVVGVPSYAEAVDALALRAVDAVIVNQRVEDCTGLDALKNLRRSHATLPLVSVGPKAAEHAALQNGATVFLNDEKWKDLGTMLETVLSPS